ncbi:MAG: DNA replication and repair protein RecF [Victivallales bacterium]|nr:DNA replication and repair protein RecF [Victivallales bacterium]
MPLLKKLKLYNFRNYAKKEIDFSAEKVVLSGANGVGKTTILEAIYFLSILRSFRGASIRDLFKIGSNNFELSALIALNGYSENLKVIQQGNKRETWIDSNRIRRSSEFIREFRTVVFVPEDHHIANGSSSFRRRFFDMLISTLDGDYLSSLSSYSRALSQRNKALKTGINSKIIAAFEPELAINGPIISEKRHKYSKIIEKELNLLLSRRNEGIFSINYRSDYPDNSQDYMFLLEKNREKEIIRGCTLKGPQLDEFEFFLNKKELRYYGSNGQIRMISLLLKLSEFNLIRRFAHEKVAVLIDDVTNELDEKNKIDFFDAISGADQQFFTFTEPPPEKYFFNAQIIPV